MRSLRALIATAFALFVMGAGVGDTLQACRAKKTLHASCCCPHEAKEASAHDNSELSRPRCCDETVLETAVIPPSTTSLAAFAVAAPLLFEVTPPADVEPPLRARGEVRRALDNTPRLPTGPPKPILYRSLLI